MHVIFTECQQHMNINDHKAVLKQFFSAWRYRQVKIDLKSIHLLFALSLFETHCTKEIIRTGYIENKAEIIINNIVLSTILYWLPQSEQVKHAPQSLLPRNWHSILYTSITFKVFLHMLLYHYSECCRKTIRHRRLIQQKAVGNKHRWVALRLSSLPAWRSKLFIDPEGGRGLYSQKDCTLYGGQ